jgi:Cu/Ag efflux pump CusA
MIQHLVDFALRQRLVVFAATLLLVALGIQAYLTVPIEAYPDVGDTQVQVITQWSGHAAEELERQITLPLERALNTAPHQTTVRSVSIAGLSVVSVTFADGTDDYFARQQVLERLADVELPDGANPALGPLASPIAEIMRYQLVNCRERDVPECSAADREIEPKPLSELERVEGRLFRPMAFTVGFALLGALILSITLVPVVSTYLLRGRLREARNPLLELVRRFYLPSVGRLLAKPRWVFAIASVLLVCDAALYASIGSEFLPHLNEGALWVRASMPGNISLAEAESLVDGYSEREKRVRGMREILRDYPEVSTMAVQLGRPDDGTDPTGFFNAEFLLVLKPREAWRPRFQGERERSRTT